jgi:hypothetical protein
MADREIEKAANVSVPHPGSRQAPNLADLLGCHGTPSLLDLIGASNILTGFLLFLGATVFALAMTGQTIPRAIVRTAFRGVGMSLGAE